MTEDARDTFQHLEEVIIERWDGGGPTSRAADILERITRYVHFDIAKYLQDKEVATAKELQKIMDTAEEVVNKLKEKKI